jgi:hypothetical protein
MMPEQRASMRTGVISSLWGNSPQEAFVGILNNAAKRQTPPRGPVRNRGFVVLVRNTKNTDSTQAVSLQAVQQWCLQQTWNDCLAARYRIDSKPVFGTLFAAVSDDSERVRADGLPGRKLYGSVLFRPDSHWPKEIRQDVFKGLTDAISRREDSGAISAAELLPPINKMLAEHPGGRLVLLAEVFGDPDPSEWNAAKAGLFELLPERMGLVLSGAPSDFWVPDNDPHYLELDLDDADAEDDKEKTSRYQAGPLTSDRPSHDDGLGVQRYADALAQFVLHPGTTPLTVAIHGPWGKGKSTFMLLIQQSLRRGAAAAVHRPIGEVPFDADGRPRRPDRVGRRAWKRALRDVQQQVVTVGFNAWRFQDSTQIWAGLASVITSRLEAALPWWRRLLTPLAQAWRTRRAQLITELVLPGVTALLILALAALGVPPLVNWLQSQLASNALAKLLGAVVPAVGAVVASFWIVASQTRRVLQPVSERVLAYMRRPDYRQQMGYQNQVLDDLQFVKHRLRGGFVKYRLRGDRTEPRMFVFIDDLDRCPTDTIMEILQAINLILGESDFYVFLGIDTEMIYRAIDAHYDSGGSSLGQGFADKYLQKIVQLPFYLPETPVNQRASFIADLFSEASREGTPDSPAARKAGSDSPSAASALLAAKLEFLPWNLKALGDPLVAPPTPVQDTWSELTAFIDFLPYLSDNPREVKRLVNIHRFVKIVLQGQGRPVPEQETQRKLVKWLIFCDRWPNLVDEALEYAGNNCGDPNPIANLENLDSQARDFAGKTGPDDVLTADDLAPHGPLAQAASISHLIVWKSATGQAADDEASVRPAGKAGKPEPALAVPAEPTEAKERQGPSAKTGPRRPPHGALRPGPWPSVPPPVAAVDPHRSGVSPRREQRCGLGAAVRSAGRVLPSTGRAGCA